MNLDANVNNEIFRRDHPIIIAMNRHLATIGPVRLAHDTDGYLAGQVLVRNTGTGEFEKYSSSSGSYDASCVLMESVDGEEFQGSTGTALARGIFGGELFQDKLIDLDAGAITELGAKTIVDARNVNVLKF